MNGHVNITQPLNHQMASAQPPTLAGHALFLGLVYGIVHVVGPDHLGTLITLSSSVREPVKAFNVGGAWGLGHSFGMVFVALIVLATRKAVPVDVDAWEYYGNYIIGASMVACGVYFIASESNFLTEEADGSIVAKPCACHGSTRPMPNTPEVPEALPLARGSCTTYGTTDHPFARSGRKEKRSLGLSHSYGSGCCAGDPEVVDVQKTGPVFQEKPDTGWDGRGSRGALLGMLQGLCCPLGMVGATFLAGLKAEGMAIFLVVFMCVSAFGTASLSVCWAWLTAHGLGGALSPKYAYRASCGFTITLGVVWIISNYLGFTDKLEYAESFART